ncbi:MAG: sigma-70 family RNA polymerase sigma factor [Polyangiaceae bacterium]
MTTGLRRLPSRLTPAQQALARSDEAQQVVRWAVRRFAARYPDAERGDIEGLAQERIARAARSYDPTLGVSFGAYAALGVQGYLHRELGRERYRKGAVAALLAEAERRRLRALPTADESPEEAAATLAGALGEESWALALRLLLHPEVLTSPEDILAARRVRHALEEGRATLPEPQALVVTRHLQQGVSLKAVAAELGCHRSTVYRHLDAALGALRAFLEARGLGATEALGGSA